MSEPAFTFSSAERAEKCPGSHALPRTQRDSEPARRGTAVHNYVRRAAEIGAEGALELVPDDMREDLRQYDLTGLPQDPSAHAAEVAFALNLRTGAAREIGRNVERRYAELGVGPDEIAGSADYVALMGEDRVSVDDLKSGYSRVTSAKHNLQLGGLAVAATRAYGRTAARVRLLVRRESGTGYFESAELDAFDLDATFARLRQTFDRVRIAREVVAAGLPPELHEGSWCAFCPAFGACPAKKELVLALAENPDRVLDEVRRSLTDENAPHAYERLRVIKQAVHFVEVALREWAIEHPIRLSTGEIYGLREVQKKVLDGRKTFDVLSELHGVDVALAAVEVETSQAAIERALRPIAPARGLTRMKREVIDALDARGGLTLKRSPRVELHRGSEPSEEE